MGRFLTCLSPVRTHSHRTVGIVIGISVTFFIPHASVVANLLPSVTITVTTSGSYLGTRVPPCLRIWGGRVSDERQVWDHERSYIFHFLLRPVPSVPHVDPNVENLPPAQVLTDIRDSSIWIAEFLDQHLGVLHRSHLGGFVFPLLRRYRRVLLRLDPTKSGSATKRHCSGGTFRWTSLRM